MWEVLVRREVRPVIDALKGQRTGYGDAYSQLQRDPCLIYPPGPNRKEGRPFAYRVSGPLHKKVCATHLRQNHRLGFSMRKADREGIDGIVEVLYVGPRDKRERSKDFWTIIHDLFGVDNPPQDHLRPPCCAGELPEIDEAEVEEFMNRLRHLLRGR